MEGIFNKPKKAGKAKQSSLLETNVFRRVEPVNPLNNAPEEMKQQESIVFKGVAENQHGVVHDNDGNHFKANPQPDNNMIGNNASMTDPN